MLALCWNIRRGTTPITAVRVSWLLNMDLLPCVRWLTTGRSIRKQRTVGRLLTIPNTGNILDPIAKCRYKTKMDKHSGFWQVNLTAAAQELLAFITPKCRVFKWKVRSFRVLNAAALFQELMNPILYILRHRPLVQELTSRGAEMEADIDELSLGTNTQEDHVLLLREVFTFCQESHLHIKLEKYQFMKEEMECGFGCGVWLVETSRV